MKQVAAESALPDFDLSSRVGSKIRLQRFRRAVILCVVDIADFDGSLPRAALADMLPDLSKTHAAGYRLVVAVNKCDLLPKEVTEARLQVRCDNSLNCMGSVLLQQRACIN